jgi:hypothetical protein
MWSIFSAFKIFETNYVECDERKNKTWRDDEQCECLASGSELETAWFAFFQPVPPLQQRQEEG